LQLEALLALGDATKERKYLEFVQKVMADRHMPPEYRHPWRTQFYTSLSFEILTRSGEKNYIRPYVDESLVYRDEVVRSFDGVVSVYVSDLFDHLRSPIVSTPSGEIHVRKEWRPILLDHAQEYASRMAKTGCLTGNDALYEEAVNQIELMRAALRDSRTGLWAHGRGFLGSAETLTETKWGRGHAWVLRGLVETLTYLTPGSHEATRVEKILREFSATLMRYQDGSGFWRQVVDRSDSYEETSATGLISYYLSRAVQQRLLPEKPYREAARNAFEAIAASKVSADGDVYGGSKTTPPLPSTADYLSWETPVNDGHAVAAVIFSAAGQIALKRESDRGISSRAMICAQP
jgi:hypothetical protein